MRRHVIALRTVVAVMAGSALIAAGCDAGASVPGGPSTGGDPVAAVEQGSATLEQESGGVVVIATFDPTKDPGVLEVAFDTHSVDLSFDVEAFSVLEIDDQVVPIGNWNGTEPGGHHRFGTLEFGRVPASGEAITFAFTGLPERLTFSWIVP